MIFVQKSSHSCSGCSSSNGPSNISVNSGPHLLHKQVTYRKKSSHSSGASSNKRTETKRKWKNYTENNNLNVDDIPQKNRNFHEHYIFIYCGCCKTGNQQQFQQQYRNRELRDEVFLLNKQNNTREFLFLFAYKPKKKRQNKQDTKQKEQNVILIKTT